MMEDQLSFSISENNLNITLSNSIEPDSNFFNTCSFETSVLSITESRNLLKKTDNNFSVLNFNIRSMRKNFENLKLLLQDLNFSFKIICLTETWTHGDKWKKNSNFSIPGYTVAHQSRANQIYGNGGGVCIFVHNSLNYKPCNNLCINESDCEALTVDIINKHTRNIIT